MRRVILIAWLGGKQRLLRFLKQNLPPHRFYAELFGGGAALLLNKKPAEREFYNDADAKLSNLFDAAKSDGDFIPALDFFLHSRRLFYRCRKQRDALSIFYTARNSFSGWYAEAWAVSKYARSHGIPAAVSTWLSTLKRLPHVQDRLRTVEITNLDWRQWIEEYNPNTRDWFLYLDPPYVHSTRKRGTYAVELSDSDHEELIDFCLQTKCKIMLSGYDNEIYRRLEQAGWRKEIKETTCACAARTELNGLGGEGKVKEQQKRFECLWMNY